MASVQARVSVTEWSVYRVYGTVKRGQGTGSKIQGKEQLVYLFATLVFIKLTIVKTLIKRQIFQLYILHLNVLSEHLSIFC